MSACEGALVGRACEGVLIGGWVCVCDCRSECECVHACVCLYARMCYDLAKEKSHTKQILLQQKTFPHLKPVWMLSD